MKVLQIIGGISPRHGGSKAVLGMCRELRRLGLDTHIATTDSDTAGRLHVPLGHVVEVQGAAVFHFSSPILTRYGFSWKLGHWLRNNLATYDVIHIHGFFVPCLISAVPRARRLHIPYIIRPMGHLATRSMQQSKLVKRAFLAAVGHRYLNHAEMIHYTSRQEQAETEKLGIRTKGAVIPLGVDGDDLLLPPRGEFRKLHPEIGERKIVLFLSRLDPIKGLELLLEAVKEVSRARDDFVLLIAGEGEAAYQQKLRDMARSLGLDNKAIFVGFVDGDEKRALLADLEVSVLPSYQENFSMAVVEAMAAGLPVIVSDKVQIHPAIREKGAGVVVACDASQIASALERLLSDDPLRRRMGQNARRLVEEKYHWNSIAPRIIELYRAVLEQTH